MSSAGIELTRACLPLMRANGGGRIVNCSSVLGLVAMKWRGAYNASKFAIEALSDTLRLELAGSNIHVVLIEPGPIATRFTEHALEAFDRNIDQKTSHYEDAYARQRARLGRGGTQPLQTAARGGASRSSCRRWKAPGRGRAIM